MPRFDVKTTLHAIKNAGLFQKLAAFSPPANSYNAVRRLPVILAAAFLCFIAAPDPSLALASITATTDRQRAKDENDIKDHNGTNALFSAVKSGKVDVVGLLLAMGADPNIKDEAGKTPFDYAATYWRKYILIDLLKAGADVTFFDFLDAFTEDIWVQRAFVKRPFVQQLEKNGQTLKNNFDYLSQIRFPLIPNAAIRKSKGWSLHIERSNTQGKTEKSVVTLTAGDGHTIAVYTFVRAKYWQLAGMKKISAQTDDFFEPNWLEALFPDVKYCTPDNLYYDRENQKSNDATLEKRGYKKPLLRDLSAFYDINETFYGFKAVELGIPDQNDNSLYTVTVNATAEELAKKIETVTGQKISIFDGESAHNGLAFINKKGSMQTMFLCSTLEDGYEWETVAEPGNLHLTDRNALDYHSGNDFTGPAGTPVPAASKGVVAFSGTLVGYGNVVAVRHDIAGKYVYTLYAHLQKPSLLRPGDKIEKNQNIGFLGNSGIGNHPRLHFEIISQHGVPLIKGHETLNPAEFDFPD